MPRPRRLWRMLLAVMVLWVLSGVVPILMYAESHTVPAGADTQTATVTGYPSSLNTNRSGRKNNGGVARVELADGSSTTVYLDSRADEGDTLTLYREDGELRATAERSPFTLVGGILALLFWPASTLVYLRQSRHAEVARRPIGGPPG